MLVEALERRLRVALVAQLRVAVVLDDQRRRCAAAQAQQLHPPRDRHRAAVRVLPRRGDQHGGRARRAAGRPAARGRRPGRGPSGTPSASKIRWRCGLHGSSTASVAPVGQPQSRRGREGALGAGRHDHLVGRRAHRPGHPEVRRELGAQPRVALRVAIRRRGRRVGREVPPRPRQQPLPERPTGTGRGWWSRSGSRTAARERVPPKNGRRGPGRRPRSAGRAAPPAGSGPGERRGPGTGGRGRPGATTVPRPGCGSR